MTALSTAGWVGVGLAVYVALFITAVVLMAGALEAGHVEDELLEQDVEENAHPMGNVHVLKSNGWDYPPRGGKPRD